MNLTSRSLLIALGASLAALSATGAEMPTDAQKEAVRTDCRDDFLEYCKDVEPGGLPALERLENNMDNLSEACQAAVTPVEKETGTGGSSGG